MHALGCGCAHFHLGPVPQKGLPGFTFMSSTTMRMVSTMVFLVGLKALAK